MKVNPFNHAMIYIILQNGYNQSHVTHIDIYFLYQYTYIKSHTECIYIFLFHLDDKFNKYQTKKSKKMESRSLVKVDISTALMKFS